MPAPLSASSPSPTHQPQRPLVIIEHPWSQLPPAIRQAYLRLCIQDCLRRGEAPIASVPIFCHTDALDDLKPEERAQGIASGLEWYRVAERCVAYTDHGVSAGMMQGMAAAQAAGVLVEVRELWPTQRGPDPAFNDLTNKSGLLP